MSKNIIIFIFFLFFIFGVYINFKNDFKGTYVLKGVSIADTLILNSGGEYKRIMSLEKDSVKIMFGKWYIDKRHITFLKWSNRNNLVFSSFDKEYLTVSCSFTRNVYFKPNCIYIDHSKCYYYERIP